MKNLFIIIQLFLILSVGLSSTVFSSTPGKSQVNAAQENYILVRYVVGSGGITGAVSTNYMHWATAGEAVVGGMQGPNNFLFAGFWYPGLIWTEVEQQETMDLPTSFKLHQNFPNPFNPQTVIHYELPFKSLVTVEIFNVMGQRIRLLSSQIQGPGQLQVIWDGRDEQGKMMGSGIYLYRVTALETKAGKGDANVLFQQTKKMLLVK